MTSGRGKKQSKANHHGQKREVKDNGVHTTRQANHALPLHAPVPHHRLAYRHLGDQRENVAGVHGILESIYILISSLHVYHESITRLRAFHVAGRARAGKSCLGTEEIAYHAGAVWSH